MLSLVATAMSFRGVETKGHHAALEHCGPFAVLQFELGGLEQIAGFEDAAQRRSRTARRLAW
jgi:hypothetical protein